MNYYLQYKNTFDFGNRVQRQYLYQNPRNFYRISRYENVDGEVKSLVGNNSSIIFVIGIYENKVNCIKINEIRPQIFLRWFSTLIKNGITVEDIDKIFWENCKKDNYNSILEKQYSQYYDGGRFLESPKYINSLVEVLFK